MKKNMAVGDRLLRFVVAVILLVLFFTRDFSTSINAIFLTVAGIFIVTAFTGRCPLYTLLGIDTRQFKY